MWRGLGVGALLVVILILAAATRRRVDVWHDDLSLWTNAVAVSPGLLRPHFNRRAALVARGRWTEAIDECVTLLDLIAHGAGTPSERAFAASFCSRR